VHGSWQSVNDLIYSQQLPIQLRKALKSMKTVSCSLTVKKIIPNAERRDKIAITINMGSWDYCFEAFSMGLTRFIIDHLTPKCSQLQLAIQRLKDSIRWSMKRKKKYSKPLFLGTKILLLILISNGYNTHFLSHLRATKRKHSCY